MAVFKMKVLVKGVSSYDDKKEKDSATGHFIKHYQVDLYGMEGQGADFQAGLDIKGDIPASNALRALAEKARSQTLVAAIDLVTWKGSTFFKLVGFEGAK